MLLILITCSQVYLGNVVAGDLPPPPPIFPPVTFPRYVTHGIPKMQGNTSALASHSNVAPPTSVQTGQEDNNTSPEEEEDELKQRLLEVTPGSSEAEDLMEILEKTAKKISHPKSQTAASLLGIFAKALWKERQGMFQGHFYGLMSPLVPVL
jgi:hypothetical protein